jgi:hypothetical protein
VKPVKMKLGLAICVLISIFVTTGCAVNTQTSLNPPSPTPSASADEVKDIGDEFRAIADASCQLARETGVTERADGTTSRSVLVPDIYAYNDFFAAVVSDAGGQEPIWTVEDFASCVDFINYVMAEESGSEYEILLSGDLDSGLIRSEYVVDDSSSVLMDYVVKDGVFVEVLVTSPDSSTKIFIEYGAPSDQDIQYFREAIDLWLSSN